MSFGQYLRQLRESRGLTLRGLAESVGIEPGYLSRIERDDVPPPSEEKLRPLALALGQDPDVFGLLAGRVSALLLEVLQKRPQVVADLIRDLGDAPDQAIYRVVREVRDGSW